MVTLPGGRFWSFCCWALVFGVILLKPDATSMFSLFCVLVDVLAQPIVSANSAAKLILLNDTICLSFLHPCSLGLLGFVLSAPESLRKRDPTVVSSYLKQ